jgi:hypothetical protein
MAAAAWCNVLEGFLRGISATALDATAIARVRAAFPDTQIEWDSPDSAKDKITSRMLPSTKKKGQSMKYIEAVFGCQIDPAIVVSLQSLVSFRQEVTHPSRGRTHDEHDPPSADQWIAWSAAVRALAGTVIRSLADRIDERRVAGEVIPLSADGRGNPPVA